MPNLFVDCDDTLVLWIYEEKSIGDTLFYTLPNEGEKYTVNEALIASVNSFLETHPDWQLIIWSGGGWEYASQWARKFFPERKYLFDTKMINFPKEEDICIDDQEIKVKATLYTYQEWLEYFKPV